MKSAGRKDVFEDERSEDADELMETQAPAGSRLHGVS